MKARRAGRVLRAAMAAVVLSATAGVVGLAFGASLAHAHTVQRGLAAVYLHAASAEEVQSLSAEMGTKLRADVVRVDVSWDRAEPSRGVYDDASYLAWIATQVDAARAQGLQVVVMVCYVPRWASDRSFWEHPPSSTMPKGYEPYYPIDAGSLDDFRLFSEHLATLLKGKVLAYECWNEPNLWPYIYPQQYSGDAYFAIHTYLKYLKRFWAGVKAGDPEALVVAGSTSPGGSNDKIRTSPQRFAQVLEGQGAADFFDVYSHHPYVMGGTANLSPAAPPSEPQTMVTMYNLKTLLQIFPNKPFYLTEYGYNTEYALAFGATVSEVNQARYLKQAYAMAAKHPQVKMLMWYLVRDWSPKGEQYDSAGTYTGLRALRGGAKRSWYAFARGNRITLDCPTRARKGAQVRLQGNYTCASIGGVKNRQLLLQRKWSGSAWRTLRTVTTGEEGRYKTFVRLSRTTRYRLVFAGVVSSAGKVVRAT